MRLTLIQVPYDSGRFGERMGAGPLRLVEAGLVDGLAAGGHEVELVEVRLDPGFATEVGSAVAIQLRAAAATRDALAAGRLPVLLTGNCNHAALGAVAALGTATTAVVWLDAHGDLNTPDTSPSGFFDGMALAVLTGRAFCGLAARWDGLATPLAEERIALVGARDLDPGERQHLAGSPILVVPTGELERLEPWLEETARRVDRVYLHVDLDALDPAELSANAYATPGGLTVADVERVIAAVRRRFALGAVAFTSYDPTADRDGRGPAVVVRLLAAVCE